MADPYIGQIQTFAFNFAPRNWALCDGQLLSISQYTALFSLIGTTYGGDGRTTFALPDLRGRASIHQGTGPGLSNRPLGTHGGSETNVLNANQMPSHSHTATTHCQSGSANSNTPVGTVWAAEAGGTSATYSNAGANQQMSSTAVTLSNSGGSSPVNNLQPYLTVSFCICLLGLYPPRS